MENMNLYIDWLLVIVMFLGFIQQLFSAKFNLYGTLTIISLATYIAIHTYDSEFNIFVLLLFIGAIILIVLEMFVPGGILGVVGIITLLYALIYINKTMYNITFIIVISIILSIILYLVNRKIFKRTLLFLNRFILNDAVTTDAGYVAKETDNDLIGKKMIAHTDLRPAGIASLGEVRYDVVTEGDFIERGKNIEVVTVDGMKIVVRQYK